MSIGRSPDTLGRHEEEPEDAEPGKAGPVRVHRIAVSDGVTGAPFLSSTTATVFSKTISFVTEATLPV